MSWGVNHADEASSTYTHTEAKKYDMHDSMPNHTQTQT